MACTGRPNSGWPDAFALVARPPLSDPDPGQDQPRQGRGRLGGGQQGLHLGGVALRVIAPELVDTKQYLDFLRNRTFRKTLLCRAGLKLNRALTSQQMVRFHFASSLTSTGDSLDIASEKSEG